MAESQLPTKRELEQVYYRHGKEALVWCVWRHLLRMTIMLGENFRENFGESSWKGQRGFTSSAYISIREIFVLTLLVEYSDQYKVEDSYLQKIVKPSGRFVKKWFSRKMLAGLMAATYDDESKVVLASTDILRAQFCFYEEDDFCRFFSMTRSLLQADLKYLTSEVEKPPKLFGDTQPQLLASWSDALVKQLTALDLEFLAEDLCHLWEGKIPSFDRLKNYSKDLSEEIISDPIALQKIIKEGVEVDKIQAVRCLLLGPGGAGKSSLADRLQGRELETIDEDGTTYVKVKSVTTGVDYLEHQPLKLEKHFKECNLGEQPLDLYLWDFGGQTIFHGLHSAFLHENCVYVLVVDSRHEQAPDEWLYQIEHLAGSARVLLVTNWYENCESRQNETRLLRKFPNLLSPDSFFYFSCHEPNPKTFREFIESLVRNAFASQVASFAEELEIWAELKKELKQQVFIGGGKVKKFIKERLKYGDAADTMKRYRGLGFLVEVVDQEGFYCLDPSWAVDNGYRLLHAEPLRQVRDNNKSTAGIADLPTLKEYLDEKHEVDEEETKHLVDFLKDRNLCCQLVEDRRYFFPDAASADEPESVKELVNQEESLTVRFDLPYLPLGFHAGMVSRLFQTNKPVAIRQPTDIWRQGFILHGDGDSAKAVVSYQMRKSTIGLVLVGEDLAEAANILETFRVALHDVLGVGKSGIEEAHLQPFVVWNEWASTLLSGNELISLLGSTGSYGELVEKIKQLENEVKEAMASKYNINVGDNSQVAVDAKHVTQQHQSNNVEVTSDQREQIALMASTLLENFKGLKPEELTAVAVVNQALEEPEAEQSQKLLGAVANGLDKTVGFANNAVGVGEFVAKNWGAITAAFTAAAAVIS